MISCRETARLLSEATVDRLPFRRRLALRFHLTMCNLCRRSARQMRAIEESVRRFGSMIEEDRTAFLGSLSPDARDRIKAALKSDG